MIGGPGVAVGVAVTVGRLVDVSVAVTVEAPVTVDLATAPVPTLVAIVAAGALVA